jgi:DNA-binding transcriptional MerR regulator
MEKENSKRFLSIKELAKRYNINPRTFVLWLDKIKKDMPLYEENQRLFSPAQVAYFESMFC